ncbi:MAG: T9SS type A sorting domain-containing protein, partial [Lewinella sp.]|nr:T9SS type A sorting domain-containing protein [Lewinella sp.]
IGGAHLGAQISCDPDTMLPDTVAVDPFPYTADNPLAGITDTACVGEPFATVFQINLPTEITINGTVVGLNGATIAQSNAILNLPSSMTYACNPGDCVYTAGEVGCLVIYGEATADDVGQHDLKIAVTLDIGIPIAQTLPNAAIAPGNYYLNVKPEGSANCTVVNDVPEITENGFDLRVMPNPLSDYAEVQVVIPTADDYQLTIFNAMGAAVQQETLALPAGEGYFTLDASRLPVGLYVFTLRNNEQAASGRILIQR